MVRRRVEDQQWESSSDDDDDSEHSNVDPGVSMRLLSKGLSHTCSDTSDDGNDLAKKKCSTKRVKTRSQRDMLMAARYTRHKRQKVQTIQGLEHNLALGGKNYLDSLSLQSKRNPQSPCPCVHINV